MLMDFGGDLDYLCMDISRTLIEDTVLITQKDCEVLTGAVPKEINEIEALFRKRDRKK